MSEGRSQTSNAKQTNKNTKNIHLKANHNKGKILHTKTGDREKQIRRMRVRECVRERVTVEKIDNMRKCMCVCVFVCVCV